MRLMHEEGKMEDKRRWCVLVVGVRGDEYVGGGASWSIRLSQSLVS